MLVLSTEIIESDSDILTVKYLLRYLPSGPNSGFLGGLSSGILCSSKGILPSLSLIIDSNSSLFLFVLYMFAMLMEDNTITITVAIATIATKTNLHLNLSVTAHLYLIA